MLLPKDILKGLKKGNRIDHWMKTPEERQRSVFPSFMVDPASLRFETPMTTTEVMTRQFNESLQENMMKMINPMIMSLK